MENRRNCQNEAWRCVNANEMIREIVNEKWQSFSSHKQQKYTVEVIHHTDIDKSY